MILIMKKIILKSFLVFIFSLFILAPNIILAEEEQQAACKNSYISNVLPGANSKIDSFKYFLLELKKDANKDSVKFYINGEEQNVNVIEKANGQGYLGIIKADQSLNKAGTLLLEIAASGSNENKCDDNFFVGLEIVKPVVLQKNIDFVQPLVPVEEKLIEETSEEETSEEVSNLSLDEDENQMASIKDSIKEFNGESNGRFLGFLIFFLIIIGLFMFLFKKKKR